MENIFFEQIIIIILAFCTFPFDSILGVPKISEDELKMLHDFFTQYLHTDFFKYDLATKNLTYIKTPGYYENLQEKFFASSEMSAILKNCKNSHTMSRELRLEFIKYISSQQGIVGNFISNKIAPYILPTYILFVIVPYVKITYALLCTIKGLPYYKSLMMFFFEQNLKRNPPVPNTYFEYTINILGEITKFLKEFFF